MTISEIIFLFVSFQLILILLILYRTNQNTMLFFTPKYIYNNTEMNIFGCIICSILLYCIFPLYTMVATIVWLIWKLFHIGRNNIRKGD